MHYFKTFYYIILLSFCLINSGNTQESTDSGPKLWEILRTGTISGDRIYKYVDNIEDMVGLRFVCHSTSKRIQVEKQEIIDFLQKRCRKKNIELSLVYSQFGFQEKLFRNEREKYQGKLLAYSHEVIELQKGIAEAQMTNNRLYHDQEKRVRILQYNQRKLEEKNQTLNDNYQKKEQEVQKLTEVIGRSIVKIDEYKKNNDALSQQNFILKGVSTITVATLGVHWLFGRFIQPKLEEAIKKHRQSQNKPLSAKQLRVFSTLIKLGADGLFFGLSTFVLWRIK